MRGKKFKRESKDEEIDILYTQCRKKIKGLIEINLLMRNICISLIFFFKFFLDSDQPGNKYCRFMIRILNEIGMLKNHMHIQYLIFYTIFALTMLKDSIF